MPSYGASGVILTTGVFGLTMIRRRGCVIAVVGVFSAVGGERRRYRQFENFARWRRLAARCHNYGNFRLGFRRFDHWLSRSGLPPTAPSLRFSAPARWDSLIAARELWRSLKPIASAIAVCNAPIKPASIRWKLLRQIRRRRAKVQRDQSDPPAHCRSSQRRTVARDVGITNAVLNSRLHAY